MTLIATSGVALLFPILLALACLLMMILMMRGHGHGHGGKHAHGGEEHTNHLHESLDDLKRKRDELNEEIGRRAEDTVSR